jgi:hypothetical protein
VLLAWSYAPFDPASIVSTGQATSRSTRSVTADPGSVLPRSGHHCAVFGIVYSFRAIG